MSYEKDLKKIMILYPGVNVSSKDDYRHLINIHNVAESIFGDELDLKLVKETFNNKNSFKKLSSKNDYYYLIFSTISKTTGFSKKAYPTIDNRSINAEYDLHKWAELVYKIYSDVQEKGVNFQDAVEYYSQNLDKDSDEPGKFKKWLSYYNKGEAVKYSKEVRRSKLDEISKKAIFNLNAPSMTSNHADGSGDSMGIVPSGIAPVGEKSTTNLGVSPRHIQNLIEQTKVDLSTKEKDKKSARDKMHRAIRSLDRILRNLEGYYERDIMNKLWNILHQLNLESMNIKTATTASDISYKYANKFKKLGFNDGYNELIKYSQESPDDLLKDVGVTTDAAPAPADQNSKNTEPPVTTAAPVEVAAKSEGEDLKTKDDLSTPLERALSPVAEVKKQEYESLAGEVDLGDAVSKLEDIAGRLSDRRTIRLLAEFDIILDKIGIAPMFPELAEAQSKLIDAYSYALVRVTKMLGMLSSGKSIYEISESKRNELVGKTLKEVNKGIEQGAAVAEALETAKSEGAEQKGEAAKPEVTPPIPLPSSAKGPETTQEGLEAAGLTQPPAPTPEAAPEAATPPPAAEPVEAPKV